VQPAAWALASAPFSCVLMLSDVQDPIEAQERPPALLRWLNSLLCWFCGSPCDLKSGLRGLSVSGCNGTGARGGRARAVDHVPQQISRDSLSCPGDLATGPLRWSSAVALVLPPSETTCDSHTVPGRDLWLSIAPCPRNTHLQRYPFIYVLQTGERHRSAPLVLDAVVTYECPLMQVGPGKRHDRVVALKNTFCAGGRSRMSSCSCCEDLLGRSSGSGSGFTEASVYTKTITVPEVQVRKPAELTGKSGREGRSLSQGPLRRIPGPDSAVGGVQGATSSTEGRID